MPNGMLQISFENREIKIPYEIFGEANIAREDLVTFMSISTSKAAGPTDDFYTIQHASGITSFKWREVIDVSAYSIEEHDKMWEPIRCREAVAQGRRQKLFQIGMKSNSNAE